MKIIDLFEITPTILIKYNSTKIILRQMPDLASLFFNNLAFQFKQLGCRVKYSTNRIKVTRFNHLGEAKIIVDKIQPELEKFDYIVKVENLK